MNKKALGSLARVAISFILIGALLFVKRKDLESVALLLLNINIPLFVTTVLLAFVAHLLLSIRLRLFLTAQNIMVSIKEAYGLTLIGFFFNNFMPTAVGGDVVKAFYTSKKTEGKLHSFTSVFMDRFTGAITLALLALCASFLLSGEVREKIIVWPIWVLFAMAMLVLAALFNERIIGKVSSFKFFGWTEKLHSSLSSFKGKKGLFPKALLTSAIAQVIFFTEVYLLVRVLHDYVPFTSVLLLMAIINIMSMMPSINGLGVREWGFLMFFGPFIGSEKALALALLWFFIFIISSMCGGFIYAFAKHGKRGDIQ